MYLSIPAVILCISFAIWALFTAIWSPNPILTAGKSIEFGLIIVAAILIVRASNEQVSNRISSAFMVLLIFIGVANSLIWKIPLPIVSASDGTHFTLDLDPTSSTSTYLCVFVCRYC